MTLTGWPFLVARGHRQNYRCLLVPEPLVDAAALLSDSVHTTDPGHTEPAVEHLRTAPGGPLTLVHRTHALTLDESGAPISDEHGRPLHLIYGVAYRAGEVHHGDIDRELRDALDDALTVYRSFWSDETGFQTVTSRSSALGPSMPTIVTTPPAVRRPRNRRPVLVIGVAGVAAVVALAGGLLWRTPTERTPTDQYPADIATIITQFGVPTGTEIEFTDTADGAIRTVHVTCTDRGCRTVVPCDGHRMSCAAMGPTLLADGFNREASDYRRSEQDDPQQTAQLVDQIFRTTLHASAHYQLTWQFSTRPAPIAIHR